MSEEIEKKVLTTLNNSNVILNHKKFCLENNLSEQETVGVLMSLESDFIVKLKNKTEEHVEASKEGKDILSNGKSREATLFELVKSKGSADKNEIEKTFGKDLKIALGNAMSKKWLKQDKADGKILLSTAVDSIIDETYNLLNSVSKGEKVDSKVLQIYKKKKIITISNIKFFEITKGESFTLERKKQTTEMTFELMQKIQKGELKAEEIDFKEYNYKAKGKRVESGYLHPLLKVRTEFREIFLEMGFEEMKTNRFVESSFWNFDALFQPQQHPARDAHDTFFISNPEKTLQIPEDYLQIVKGIHEKGGFGSIGYRYDWKREETEKNLLRTHTTAISTKLLYDVSQEIKKTGCVKPRKFFSIDRVFRNETTDQTHLCEFHQIEGMVVGKGLSLGDLIGLLSTFFKRIGINDLKFKPAYNPYTEPSLEIFGVHPDLGLIEVGNSGMFRPEMLLPMGLPEDVVVIAWGLSLERPTMIKYGYKDIRLLVGEKVPLQEIAEKPICFYEEK
eukprot:gene12290-5873_t